MDDSSRETEAPELFWSFALAFYAQPGIAPLCLRLQAEGGTDVMLLIAHCFTFAQQNAPLTMGEVEALRGHVEDWRRRAVLPLRALRVDLRHPVAHLPEAGREAFRDRLKQAELAAEKVQAGMIAGWLAARRPEGRGDFVQTLRGIASAPPLPEADLALLAAAARAAIPSSA